jgi:glc operon protein GlcG
LLWRLRHNTGPLIGTAFNPACPRAPPCPSIQRRGKIRNHVNGAGSFAWRGSASSKDMAMREKISLSFDDSQAVAAACLQTARQHGVQVSIAVVDDAAALLYFSRMDGARAYTVELASQKARTAASVGVATGIIEAMARERPGPSRDSNPGGGGVPVYHQGQCAGAVGVSGAKPEIDEIIAQAGMAVLTG